MSFTTMTGTIILTRQVLTEIVGTSVTDKFAEQLNPFRIDFPKIYKLNFKHLKKLQLRNKIKIDAPVAKQESINHKIHSSIRGESYSKNR